MLGLLQWFLRNRLFDKTWSFHSCKPGFNLRDTRIFWSIQKHWFVCCGVFWLPTPMWHYDLTAITDFSGNFLQEPPLTKSFSIWLMLISCHSLNFLVILVLLLQTSLIDCSESFSAHFLFPFFARWTSRQPNMLQENHYWKVSEACSRRYGLNHRL